MNGTGIPVPPHCRFGRDGWWLGRGRAFLAWRVERFALVGVLVSGQCKGKAMLVLHRRVGVGAVTGVW